MMCTMICVMEIEGSYVSQSPLVVNRLILRYSLLRDSSKAKIHNYPFANLDCGGTLGITESGSR